MLSSTSVEELSLTLPALGVVARIRTGARSAEAVHMMELGECQAVAEEKCTTEVALRNYLDSLEALILAVGLARTVTTLVESSQLV